jgi:hypothetical protein
MSKNIIDQITSGNGPKVTQATGLPTLAKVTQQHAITRTKADIEAVRTIAAKRTQIVLEAFDQAMADSDTEIITALEQRLGVGALGFLDSGLDQEFAALLVRPQAVVDSVPVKP